MSPSLEFEDKNVELAVKKACEKLNIPREKLKHDVISYGSTGIFGLVGTKKARIRVTLPKTSQDFKMEESNAKKPKSASLEQTVKNTDVQMEAEIDDIILYPSEDDPKRIGREALQRIVDLITKDATISIEERSNRIFFDVKGGNSAVLIGKRGQTLEAMQYIVEKIVNKKRKDRIGVQVDVEGYLEKRRINLEKTAFRLSEKVKRTGKTSNNRPNEFSRSTDRTYCFKR